MTTMPEAGADIAVEFPDAFEGLFRPARYKVYYGGRGGAKSWGLARALIVLARSKKVLILCARELQNSIADSVHHLLSEQITGMGVAGEFEVLRQEIAHKASGSRFIFKGIRHNIQEIKSTEGVDICWVEEAGRLSRENLDILIPTIRKEGSEIWFSFNPEEETDAVYEKFVANTPPPGSIVRKVSWRDNPWFPAILEQERRWLLETDPATYDWVWEGGVRPRSANPVYTNVVVEAFDPPPPINPATGGRIRFRYGIDFGFARDPAAGVRCFSRDGDLYVDHEFFGIGIEIDEMAEVALRSLPGIAGRRCYADSSRPETISYMNRRGKKLDVRPCTKKSGSIEDGIAYIKSFKRVVVHPRCENTAREFKTYSWKVKANQDETLSTPEDRNNHCMDALRYALDEEINGKAKIEISGDFMKRYAAARRAYGRR